jgi:tetratricopeptide (TPR) repeat protein
VSTTERQRLEQEALQQLNRGSTDGALKAYLAILKLDPRDRRVRQKVGEIYLRQGKAADAEKHLREVADGLLKEGSHRAAVAVLKQLVSLRADAPELHYDLGECYAQSGYGSDAKACFDAAVKAWVAIGKPALAARPARRLADLSPGEVPLKLRVAELLEAGQDAAGAAATYQEVIDEYRRRGRLDEVGRIAELALKVKPEDVGLLLDAASLRISTGDFKRALQALQQAFIASPKEPRTLDLLSRAFAGAGQPDRALKVLVELSRVSAERNDHAAEVEALRRAAELAPEDSDIAGRLAAAEDRLGRFEKRLTGLACCQPHTEAELRAVVRGEVFARYGMHDRAEGEVRAALSANADSLALFAALAEVLIGAGRAADAFSWIERIIPRAGADSGAVLDRISILRGLGARAADAPDGGAPVDDMDNLVDDDLEDDVPSVPAVERAQTMATPPLPESSSPPAPAGPSGALAATAGASAASEQDEGDRLAQAGDFGGALMAWRRLLADDPTNEDVLAKIASLRSMIRAKEAESSPSAKAPAQRVAPTATPAFDDPFGSPQGAPDEGTFAEIEPRDLPASHVPAVAREAAPGVEHLDRARALAAVGEGAQALALVAPLQGLAARVVEAQALRAMSELARALDVLREATNAAPEDDPAYPEALFDLAGLYTATQKHRSALRLLEELADIAPDFRKDEVIARVRGLQLLNR